MLRAFAPRLSLRATRRPVSPGSGEHQARFPIENDVSLTPASSSTVRAGMSRICRAHATDLLAAAAVASHSQCTETGLLSLAWSSVRGCSPAWKHCGTSRLIPTNVSYVTSWIGLSAPAPLAPMMRTELSKDPGRRSEAQLTLTATSAAAVSRRPYGKCPHFTLQCQPGSGQRQRPLCCTHTSDRPGCTRLCSRR